MPALPVANGWTVVVPGGPGDEMFKALLGTDNGKGAEYISILPKDPIPLRGRCSSRASGPPAAYYYSNSSKVTKKSTEGLEAGWTYAVAAFVHCINHGHLEHRFGSKRAKPARTRLGLQDEYFAVKVVEMGRAVLDEAQSLEARMRYDSSEGLARPTNM
ncbi:hypothetical protein B0H17DRAFT_1138654 [Mycena rosella]|uniref:Uncharacterized protein n=1 Tax=Mycena rosella TaxID=1033263 RepID=A0AAD7GEA0_MYCRO|nr:hypothetical protein B0H17DRAFT_1138654 [Mycena rosella]